MTSTTPMAAVGGQEKPVWLTVSQERLMVWALAGIQFSQILDFMVMMPLGPSLMPALQINTQQFALLVSIYTLAAAGSGLLAATFVDFFERKALLLTLFALFVLASLSCVLAPDYATLLLTRGLAGMFGGVLGAMLQTIVGDAVPFERRGKASGTVMSAAAVASVIGVPASLVLASKFGWQWSFVAIALVAVVFWVLAACFVPRLPRPPATAPGRIVAQALGRMGTVLRDRNHLLAMLFMALGGFSTFTLIPYLALYLTSNVGLQVAQVPWVYAVGGAAGFFTARFIGTLADRWGKVRTYRWLALLSMVPILVQTHLSVTAFGWVLLCSTLFFTLVLGRAIPAMAITISAVQPPLRGTFMALNSALQQLACGGAAFLGGMLVVQTPTGELDGYGSAGVLALGLTACTVLLAGKIRMHTKPPAP
ncbi:MAG: MFS transporter [Pseudomonadota bacterium]